jgi:hypothetical protein
LFSIAFFFGQPAFFVLHTSVHFFHNIARYNMPSTLKALRPSSSHNSLSKSAKAVSQKPPLAESSSDEEENEEESDDEGVDAEGMEKLMKALGEDGLDEYEQAQLQVLRGEQDEEWETDEEEVEGKSGESADEDEEEEDGDEEAEGSDIGKIIQGPSDNEEEQEDAIALDDVDDSVDEDAIPRQKIEIDNKVRGRLSGPCYPVLIASSRSLSSGFAIQSSSIPHCHGRRR